ncbi:MAG: LPS-assembly protein LptD, partial [Planctomycetes bacterium]|nr:LPS-assembly protein LptD [Planctomycetota bacterium]
MSARAWVTLLLFLGLAAAQAAPPRNDRGVRQAQRTELQPVPAEEPSATGGRRISVYTRSQVKVQFEWLRDPRSNQWMAVIDQGVNVIVEGLSGVDVGPIEVSLIDISTDRLVIWTRGLEAPDLYGQKPLADDVPLEIYMEGNIIFREGERIVYANRMYYDVNNRIGIVLDAEMLTPVPDYEGLLRIKSEVLQQTGQDRFMARNSFITSSRMGRPGYRVQTGNIYLEDRQRQLIDPASGMPLYDPVTGEPRMEHERLATSRNNFLFLGELPVFYWPFLATDLEEPSFFIRRAQLKNDSVFGTQVLTNWDGYQLFGIRNRPEGTDWDISFDYLSDRGFGHGTALSYGRDDFLGIPGPVSGLVDYWGIQDRGLDNLGRGRRKVAPEKDYRYRLFWQHRHLLPSDLQLSAEVGWISDRNFLEQYYEREWDELKDQTTGVELKQYIDNSSWSITADYRLNEFFTQTDWLPRADHFWLGQSLFGDRLTWYEHSNIGFARFGTATTPQDPAAIFNYLPWETDPGGAPLEVQGERAVTRQEIDLPFLVGPVKFVPYALGEAAHWGEDRAGNDLQRLYGQLGVRASLPMWNATPSVQSDLWNLNGLAHKVVFDVDFSWSDANQDLADLPLYDPLDDDSIEAFRRRFFGTTFDPLVYASVPPQFDERSYALRSGLAGWVTSPSTEIADDLLAVRMGVRQRWQTKRGGPGSTRIIDWIVLDTHAAFFPKEDRDNFGEMLGLVDYNFRWHVGDRLTLLSEGVFDFFDSGGQVITLGGFLSRPPRGSLYAGLHLLDGPFSSTVLSLSYSYRMTDKWISSCGMSMDLGGDGNIGQRFTMTRVGESLLF